MKTREILVICAASFVFGSCASIAIGGGNLPVNTVYDAGTDSEVIYCWDSSTSSGYALYNVPDGVSSEAVNGMSMPEMYISLDTKSTEWSAHLVFDGETSVPVGWGAGAALKIPLKFSIFTLYPIAGVEAFYYEDYYNILSSAGYQDIWRSFTWLKAGGGLDMKLFDGLFIRGQALYGATFTEISNNGVNGYLDNGRWSWRASLGFSFDSTPKREASEEEKAAEKSAKPDRYAAEDEETPLLLARKAYKAGNYQRTIEYYSRASLLNNLKPDDKQNFSNAWFYRAKARYEAGNLEGALADIKRSLSLSCVLDSEDYADWAAIMRAWHDERGTPPPVDYGVLRVLASSHLTMKLSLAKNGLAGSLASHGHQNNDTSLSIMLPAGERRFALTYDDGKSRQSHNYTLTVEPGHVYTAMASGGGSTITSFDVVDVTSTELGIFPFMETDFPLASPSRPAAAESASAPAAKKRAASKRKAEEEDEEDEDE